MFSIQHCGRWTAVLILITVLSACVTPPQTRELSGAAVDLPKYVELQNTPFYPQKDYQCGPAALAMVINYHQPLTTAEQIQPLIYIPELKGSIQIEFPAAAKQFNHLAIQQDGKLISILREVANGIPVLVMQNLGLESYPFWHYAVVIGYDLPQQQIILRSGERKRLIRPFSVFERTWKRAEYWSLVVVPEDVVPVSASEQSFTRAAVILDSVKAYQSGVDRWPANYVLTMGLGNSLYRAGSYHQAADAFSKATQLDTQRSEAWNNLAYALLKQNLKSEAIAAIETALSLSPDNENLLNSYAEIKSSAD